MNYNGLIPRLVVLDIDRSLHFYTKLLAFYIEFEGVEAESAFLSFAGAQIVLEQHNSLASQADDDFSADEWRTAPLSYPFGRGMNIAIKVDNVDIIAESLRLAHYPIKMRPRETWYRRQDFFVGERQILVMDPDGYLLRFYEVLGEKSGESEDDAFRNDIIGGKMDPQPSARFAHYERFH